MKSAQRDPPHIKLIYFLKEQNIYSYSSAELNLELINSLTINNSFLLIAFLLFVNFIF